MQIQVIHFHGSEVRPQPGNNGIISSMKEHELYPLLLSLLCKLALCPMNQCPHHLLPEKHKIYIGVDLCLDESMLTCIKNVQILLDQISQAKNHLHDALLNNSLPEFEKQVNDILATMSLSSGNVSAETNKLLRNECLKRCFSNIESELVEVSKRRRVGNASRLPDKAVETLKQWLFNHIDHPYPTAYEKEMLERETGLSDTQVANWFGNARRRIVKPLKQIVEKTTLTYEELTAGNEIRVW